MFTQMFASFEYELTRISNWLTPRAHEHVYLLKPTSEASFQPGLCLQFCFVCFLL